MSKPYSVKFRGIDGTSTTRFASLSGAAKYIRDRYLGSDYIRGMDGTELQDEFGYYVLTGFTFKDLGRFIYEDGWRDFAFFTEFGGTISKSGGVPA